MKGECERWAEFLFEPEDALKELEKSGLASHLSGCPDCAVERELFLESWSALGDIDEEELEPCPFLRAKVWQKIREEECLPRPLLPSVFDESGQWRRPLLKMAAAAAAIMLGFGLGRSLRTNAHESAAHARPGGPGAIASSQGEQPLDPDLIKLASQDGFSLDLFPESTQFSPIDKDMMSALSSPRDSRAWVSQERGMVVPVEYISQSVPPRGRKSR